MRRSHHEKIDISPFKEVASTFLVIFIVIAPVLYLLETNSDAIRGVIKGMSSGGNVASIYFWFCSLTSSFLDNAPSYLLFFNIAGGDPYELMSSYSDVLKAISVSSVVMGGMTYIGNAPNMMVRAVAAKRGVKMPTFLGYTIWSSLIILPVSIIVSMVLGSSR
jgi:Na+/H+ antiporter NhaD/arsenite permease-like protein